VRVVVTGSVPSRVADQLRRAGFDVAPDGVAELAVVTFAELGRPRSAAWTIVVAEDADVVAALAAGADDVVGPSVDPAELAARIGAILRRGSPPGSVAVPPPL
jgi:hypothetical protein